MSDIILHHYPQSPVAEKVRVVLGIKGLTWNSVLIPRLPPKPELLPLTGGYRRTPVMQIGADVYCDSLCIIRALEQRFPNPSLFPDQSPEFVWGLSRWIDGPLFMHAITVVLGAAEQLPAEFAADRGRLYFGRAFDLGKLQAAVEYSLSQLQLQLAWFERQLADHRAFLAGSKPGLIDALAYYLVWFIRGRYSAGAEFIDQFEHLSAWEQGMLALGHGESQELDAQAALMIARDAQPLDSDFESATSSLTLGTQVSIVPEGDGGDPQVSGKIVGLGADTVSIARWASEVDDVVVHFPRVGYVISTKKRDDHL